MPNSVFDRVVGPKFDFKFLE